MPVDNEKGLSAVPFPPDVVSHSPHTDKVGALVEGHAVIMGKSVPLEKLVVNGPEIRIEKIGFHYHRFVFCGLSSVALSAEGDFPLSIATQREGLSGIPDADCC